MRMRLPVLAICGLLLSLGASAAEKPTAEKRDAVVKEIDVKALNIRDERGAVTSPTVIKTAEELAKAIPNEEARKGIQKDVDFAKQQLVFFVWAGSGGDRLTFTADEGKKPVEVVFSYKRGLTKDLRHHAHLFVLPKEATWKVDRK